jgi:hypothetical protein
MSKTTWVILLGIVVILALGLWWWSRTAPVTAPGENISAPGTGPTSEASRAGDTISQINQDIDKVGIEQLDLQEIDSDLNQL